jgi:hypothetical protein
MRQREARQLGRDVVVDPRICHGKPTSMGTRILVVDVLAQVRRDPRGSRGSGTWANTATRLCPKCSPSMSPCNYPSPRTKRP